MRKTHLHLLWVSNEFSFSGSKNTPPHDVFNQMLQLKPGNNVIYLLSLPFVAINTPTPDSVNIPPRVESPPVTFKVDRLVLQGDIYL